MELTTQKYGYLLNNNTLFLDNNLKYVCDVAQNEIIRSVNENYKLEVCIFESNTVIPIDITMDYIKKSDLPYVSYKVSVSLFNTPKVTSAYNANYIYFIDNVVSNLKKLSNYSVYSARIKSMSNAELRGEFIKMLGYTPNFFLYPKHRIRNILINKYKETL